MCFFCCLYTIYSVHINSYIYILLPHLRGIYKIHTYVRTMYMYSRYLYICCLTYGTRIYSFLPKSTASTLAAIILYTARRGGTNNIVFFTTTTVHIVWFTAPNKTIQNSICRAGGGYSRTIIVVRSELFCPHFIKPLLSSSSSYNIVYLYIFEIFETIAE